MLRLPDLVGSPLSINSLREDVQVGHKTVSSWMAILERLYAVFRVLPVGGPGFRAVRKAARHYHFDWTLSSEEPQRFENLVAAHLLTWMHYEQDVKGRDIELRYFHDVDGREVDFVVTEKRKVRLLVECKWADAEIDRGLRYLTTRSPAAEAWQISAVGRKDYVSPDGIRVAPALSLLSTLV
jgi:predicted AAA+ superfamily ATPase